jgi:hypothetical protein
MSAFGGKAVRRVAAYDRKVDAREISKIIHLANDYLFSHAIIHEFIPASQFNFFRPSLFFAARPFLATFFLLDPRLLRSSINKGRRRKNRRRRLGKCNAANKDRGNSKDCGCSNQPEHQYIDPNLLFL